VKPADGPALVDAAIGEHQSNTGVHALMGAAPFRDDRVAFVVASEPELATALGTATCLRAIRAVCAFYQAPEKT